MEEQSRIVSIIEVVTNVVTGFVLAMLIWKFVIPAMFPRMAGPITENLFITAMFTVSSICRGYFWRRFFANGYQNLVTAIVRRVTGGEKGKIGGTSEAVAHWKRDQLRCSVGCPLCNDLYDIQRVHYAGATTKGAACRCVQCLKTRRSIEYELGD